jgi:hypothetical protein
MAESPELIAMMLYQARYGSQADFLGLERLLLVSVHATALITIINAGR